MNKIEQKDTICIIRKMVNKTLYNFYLHICFINFFFFLKNNLQCKNTTF